jgi:predicted dehydrogenase
MSTNRRRKRGAKQAGFFFRTTDYREVIHHPEAQVVDICVPNRWHGEIIREALQAGKHVYCEKPLAYSYEEAKELAALAREAAKRGIKVQVVSEYRFFPATMKAKELAQSGFIGRLFSLSRLLFAFGLH